MLRNSKHCGYLILALLLVTGCGIREARHPEPVSSLTTTTKDSTANPIAPNGKDPQLREKIKPIKQNFERIRLITQWDSIPKKDIWESTEGGEAKYYYRHGTLEKIEAIYLGETGKLESDMYLMHNQLSLVTETNYEYNRPIYWDSTKMREMGDNEVFDLRKTQVSEVHNYLENEKLFFIEAGDLSNTLNTPAYLQEQQQRVILQYQMLKKIKTEPSR